MRPIKKTVCWLASNWNPAYVRNSPMTAFRTFLPQKQRTSRLGSPRMQRRFSFVLTSGLVGCFLCWDSIQTETKVFHVIQEIKTVVGNQQEKKNFSNFTWRAKQPYEWRGITICSFQQFFIKLKEPFQMLEELWSLTNENSIFVTGLMEEVLSQSGPKRSLNTLVLIISEKYQFRELKLPKNFWKLIWK